MRVRWTVVPVLFLLLVASGCKPSSKAALKMKGFAFTAGDYCRAVQEDKREEVLLFHKAGMAPGSGGALCVAANEGRTGMVTLLLGAGAKVDEPCTEGTPLLLAARAGHGEIVDLLAKRGADVNVADKRGVTALMHAAAKCDLTSVQALLDGKADATRKDPRGWTAWTYANERDQKDMSELLRGAGAEPFVDPDRDQFLQLAREMEPIFAGSIAGERIQRGKTFEKDAKEFRRLARLVCCQMEGDQSAVEAYLSHRGFQMSALELKMRLWGGPCGPCDETPPPAQAPAPAP